MSDTALPFRSGAGNRREAPARQSPAPTGGTRSGILLPVLAVFAIALVTGLGGTWFATSAGAGFETLKVGPWVSHPRNGAIDADPYARAVLARTGEIPLGLGEGLAFTAGRDSAGQPLVGSCSYRIVGRVPPTRYWSLTLHGVDGTLSPNPAGRFGFTSGEVVRDAKGTVAIEVSREARPGNWLPAGSDRRFQLTLRLYDTPVSGTATALEPTALPRIDRVGCP
ncbi:MAG: DUF1214 domain-containing protein [Alsobacter sp.]